MPRQPKPYYRKAQKRWVCTIQGRRITLGPNREAAFAKFHELMLNQDNLSAEVNTLYDLSQVFLDWCKANRHENTYGNYLRYLKDFISSVGRRLKIASLKAHHLTKWVQRDTWNSTTRNMAMTAVQRMLNWAVEQGHIERSPIANLTKPKSLRREVFYSDQQWKQIRSYVSDGFIDLLDFMWETGCRPKEARNLETRHIHFLQDMCIFAVSESKGEEAQRVIFLTSKAKKILEKLTKVHPTGPIFLNTRGNHWTKDSIKCRLSRISKKVGFRVIAYGTRHSYATHGLMNGTDSIVLSQLMGHQDTSMLAKVYQKLAQNPDYLREQAKMVRCA
jgi:integrase